MLVIQSKKKKKKNDYDAESKYFTTADHSKFTSYALMQK